MQECILYVFSLVIKTSRIYSTRVVSIGETSNSVQMIDARATKLSDYSYPITKSQIGSPGDRATITQQRGARRTNHERAFCY